MKKFLIAILALALLTVFILLLMNFMRTVLYGKQGVGRAEISGRAESGFIAETVSSGKAIEYVFTPKSDEARDYLLSYELKKDGKTIDYQSKKLVRQVSKDDPITLHVSRESGSEYSLKTIINDANKPSIELHNDQTVVHPQEIKQ